jgi:lactate permease
MPWLQTYNPLGNALLSTLVAALPIVVLLGSIAWLRVRIHFAALLGLGVALLVALLVYRMPVKLAGLTTFYGALFGLFPIGWIILNVIFVYQLTVKRGHFEVLRNSLAAVAPDPRIQLILIAFSLGAFIEGVAGFGTPVAITGAILIQLGFKPLHASGLALIANTAPVAFGSLGIPITTLNQVTGMDLFALSKMVGRQLPFFSLIVPFWVVAAYAGWRGMLGIWPAALTAGVAFAVPQFLVSNFHGPWLVDNVSGACSIVAVVVLLRFWKPRDTFSHSPADSLTHSPAPRRYAPREIFSAWLPWIILSGFIFIWGQPQMKWALNGEEQKYNPRLQKLLAPTQPHLRDVTKLQIPIAGLHQQVRRGPEIAGENAAPEKALYEVNWLSATGTGILIAGIIAGAVMGFSPARLFRTYLETIWHIRFSLATIAAMLALGYVSKYSGSDATLGLALAHTGMAYPFFGTLLGWLGVALTGSDTASNVLFGSLQQITARKIGISDILMGAANSSGGVMGKMVDVQSIVVASTATNYYGGEGNILRFVFWHSIVLASLVAMLVFLQAYVWPFTLMVVK